MKIDTLTKEQREWAERTTQEAIQRWREEHVDKEIKRIEYWKQKRLEEILKRLEKKERW